MTAAAAAAVVLPTARHAHIHPLAPAPLLSRLSCQKKGDGLQENYRGIIKK
jgi:hypothetical protein